MPKKTKRAVEAEGKWCILLCGDVTDSRFCEDAVSRTIKEYRQLDILVNNVAYQQEQKHFEEISEDHRLNTLQYSNPVSVVEFTPDGSRLVTCQHGGQVHIWNVHSGKLQESHQAHLETVTSLSFSLDGKILATAGEDQTARLWQLDEWGQIASLALKNILRALHFWMVRNSSSYRKQKSDVLERSESGGIAFLVGQKLQHSSQSQPQVNCRA